MNSDRSTPHVTATAPMTQDLKTEKLETLIQNIEKVLHGKRDTIELVVGALIAQGHVLLEDVPGVGKTMLARALAKSIEGSFARIQFTPDLLPADILGVSIYNPENGAFVFHRGPIFEQIILADEINRATPRAQSALLEAMNDFQVSLEGSTYALPRPFMVIATQNPIEYAGTYPLPEAQLDRFLLCTHLGYPDRPYEREMLMGQRIAHPIDTLTGVIHADEIVALQRSVREVRVDEVLIEYLLELGARTRQHSQLDLGVSPRGLQMLFRMAQAIAVLDGRDYCIPDDIRNLVLPVWSHRILPTGLGQDRAEGREAAREALIEVLDSVEVPL